MSKLGDVSRKRRLGDPVRVRFYGYWRSLRWRSRMTGRPLPPGALDGFCGWQDTPKCTEYQTPLERKPVWVNRHPTASVRPALRRRDLPISAPAIPA